jgi:hypothetical protein
MHEILALGVCAMAAVAANGRDGGRSSRASRRLYFVQGEQLAPVTRPGRGGP